MRKFENCDVLSVLREIMSHNTKHYQTDFDIDEEILTEAAEEPNALDRRYLWMSRPCGTHCLKEKDVFLFNSPEYSTWTAYAATADEIVAYAVQLNYRENGVLKGDLYELDYASHCAMAKNSAVYIAQVRLYSRDRNIIMAYSDDWRLKAREYDYDKREFIPLSQNKLDTLLGEMQKERLNGHYYPWDERKLNLEYGNTSTYSIYQLKRENFDRLFTSYHSTVEQGYTVKEDDYELAYIADNADGYDLDEIYEEFNIDRPDDFCGHSLSVATS
ncbi:MAG: YodL domain-containing protein [Christensenellaceae bacterium]